MKYIQKMFNDANIDAEFDERFPDEPNRINNNFIIKYRFGDKINGFTYHRSLCCYDCIHFVEEVTKIIQNDINAIKQRLREIKLNSLGIKDTTDN